MTDHFDQDMLEARSLALEWLIYKVTRWELREAVRWAATVMEAHPDRERGEAAYRILRLALLDKGGAGFGVTPAQLREEDDDSTPEELRADRAGTREAPDRHDVREMEPTGRYFGGSDS